jgi:hypothetical protein
MIPYILLGSFQHLVTFSGNCSRRTHQSSPPFLTSSLLPSPPLPFPPSSFTNRVTLRNSERCRSLHVFLPHRRRRARAALPGTFLETALSTSFSDSGRFLRRQLSVSHAERHLCAAARPPLAITNRSRIIVTSFPTSDRKWKHGVFDRSGTIMINNILHSSLDLYNNER